MESLPSRATLRGTTATGLAVSWSPATARRPLLWWDTVALVEPELTTIGASLGPERLASRTTLDAVGAVGLRVDPGPSRSAWLRKVLWRDEVELFEPQQLTIGRLLDPERLSVPAYIVLGRTWASF